MSEKYKRKYTFGEDYGTSFYKFGPITLGEKPRIIENRGYFPDKSSVIYKLMGITREVIVGEKLPSYLESKEDLASRLIYPMRNGVVDKDDEKAWRVIEEITGYGLKAFRSVGSDFKGYFVTAALSSIAPRYMYEKIIEIHRKVDWETGLIRAVTIIPQPLAVAIAHKAPTCIVIESGHGNTQICPISRYPIRSAIIALNRGGSDADIITSQILYDAGYGDIAKEEAIVRRIKEAIGLIPKRLNEAIREAKRNYEKYHVKYKIAGTRIEVDLGKDSWTRFLIGEYIFNPKDEMFESYFKRGMRRPRDMKIGEITFRGMMDLGEAIIESVEKCPIELQPYLYNRIILSGGNLQWKAPPQFKDVAVDSATKIKILLQEKGVEGIIVETAPEPKYSVWRGCIVYGYALPEDYKWTWENMEGWIDLHA
ncbi:MAG: hypothetical protein NDF53_01165 [archaeon GB-1867-097]|nr:hypothetical protein [Candidatus Verstraetearchaeota archaeon]MCS7384334.1 hypothetical protein [Candidatus Culexmicrobium thermophilum]